MGARLDEEPANLGAIRAALLAQAPDDDLLAEQGLAGDTGSVPVEKATVVTDV